MVTGMALVGLMACSYFNGSGFVPAKHDNIQNVTSAESFDLMVVRATTPVLVDFWAPWCAPCRAMEPTIVHIAEEFRGSVGVVKVNVDDNRALAEQYNIRAIPTLMIFNNGRAVAMFEGAMRRAALDRWLRDQLKQDGVALPDPVS